MINLTESVKTFHDPASSPLHEEGTLTSPSDIYYTLPELTNQLRFFVTRIEVLESCLLMGTILSIPSIIPSSTSIHPINPSIPIALPSNESDYP
jgi:hypothetical protein